MDTRGWIVLNPQYEYPGGSFELILWVSVGLDPPPALCIVIVGCYVFRVPSTPGYVHKDTVVLHVASTHVISTTCKAFSGPIMYTMCNPIKSIRG
jgi:hypothetical protein